MTAANQSDTPENSDVRPVQFQLKTLFSVVTGLCGLFAVMATVGWMWSAMILMLLLLVGGHVLGNALGTSMKNEASRSLPTVSPSQEVPRPVHTASGLSEKHSQRKLILLATVGGAGIGAVLGGTLVAWHDWQKMTIFAFMLGMLACAVLGGLFSFLTSCGVRITLQAWREMWHHHETHS